jgi:internalin A
MSQQALDLIAENIRTKNPVLDLGNCGLTELYPELLEELAKTGDWLKELRLSSDWWDRETEENKYSLNKGDANRLSQLPHTLPPFPKLHILIAAEQGISDCTPLAKLEQLNILDISGNQINNCAPLAKLEQLKELYISGNQINNCAPLARLTQLKKLYVYHNQITDCAPLAKFEQLKELDISLNQITDCAPLAKLEQLKELYISNNEITDCAPLVKLEQLQLLNISQNLITDCAPLAKLEQLQLLNISYNQITDCAPLAKLEQLKELYISGNEITDWAPLAKLPQLKELYISKNQITDCAPLAKLIQLNTLDISENQITDCAPLLSLIKKGIPIKVNFEIIFSNTDIQPRLYLYGNPITNPPLEILKQGNEAVIRYFESLEKDKQAGKTAQQIRELKLIFLGEGESGKTTLMKRLLDLPVVKGEKQTQGITQMKWTVTDTEGNITVNMWDFGGQEIQHNAHQFFLTEDCIYVLVLDNRRDEQPEYWLQHILSLGKNSSILVVSNKVDVPAHATDRFNQELLKGKYNIHGFYKMSALLGTNFEQFQADLLGLIKTFPFPRFSEDWIAVKDHVEAETALGKNLIMRNQLHTYCSQHVEEQDELIILSYLKTMGKVSFHAPNLHTRDFYILNPEWLIYAIYKITLSDKTVSQHGEIWLSDLEEILKPHESEPMFELRQKYVYEREQYPYLLEMMKEYHLCYTADNQHIIIPSAFPETHTLSFEATGHSLVFYLQYLDFLPPSIISQFIARMFPYKKEGRYWLSGMELEDTLTGAHALVQLDKDPKRIYITVNGEQKRAFFDVIRRCFREINKTFEQMQVDERIPLPSYEKDQSVGYLELLNHELDNMPQYYHGKTREWFSVKDLLASIQSPAVTHSEKKASQEKGYYQGKHIEEIVTMKRSTVKAPEIFFSYAWKDADSPEREKLVDELYHELLKEGYPIKRDKADVQYGDSIIQFMEELGASANIIVAISDRYLKSEYCMYELHKAYEQSNSDLNTLRQKIYPIRVETVALKDPEVLDAYFEHWEQLETKWEALVTKHSKRITAAQQAQYNRIKSIAGRLGDLLDFLSDLNASTTDMLSQDSFATIKQKIQERMRQ